MYCIKCGAKNDDDAKFCIACGEQTAAAPLRIDYHQSGNEVTTNPVVAKKKKDKLPFIMAGAVLLIGIMTFVIFFVSNASPEVKARKELKLANQYLDEMQYEMAIASYTKAIEIDPKNVDAYEGLANTYLAMAEKAYAEGYNNLAIEYYQKALDTLERGEKETKEERLGILRQDIEEKKEEKEEILADNNLGNEPEPDEEDGLDEDVLAALGTLEMYDWVFEQPTITGYLGGYLSYVFQWGSAEESVAWLNEICAGGVYEEEFYLMNSEHPSDAYIGNLVAIDVDGMFYISKEQLRELSYSLCGDENALKNAHSDENGYMISCYTGWSAGKSTKLRNPRIVEADGKQCVVEFDTEIRAFNYLEGEDIYDYTYEGNRIRVRIVKDERSVFSGFRVLAAEVIGEVITVPEQDEENDGWWEELYEQYLAETHAGLNWNYIYVDADEIPEVFVYADYYYEQWVCYISDGQVIEEELGFGTGTPGGTDYAPRNGYIVCHGYVGPFAVTWIYKLEGGKCKIVAAGFDSEEPGTQDEYGRSIRYYDNDNSYYEIEINSESEYNTQIRAAYNNYELIPCANW
ncbi:MAG: tetratricopeptide repeat protein [Lachnospiraceae bacterium]|nr:tetratricopeptide repeat protein [Lachnospiraceae bacterium]